MISSKNWKPFVEVHFQNYVCYVFVFCQNTPISLCMCWWWLPSGLVSQPIHKNVESNFTTKIICRKKICVYVFVCTCMYVCMYVHVCNVWVTLSSGLRLARRGGQALSLTAANAMGYGRSCCYYTLIRWPRLFLPWSVLAFPMRTGLLPA